MILKDEDAIKRLESPLNLINRLKNLSSNNGRKDAMGLFGIGRRSEEKIENIKSDFNPFKPQPTTPEPQQPPQVPAQLATKLDNILENHEAQIKLGLAHDKALDLLNRSVEALATKLDDVKAEKLPSVIAAASKTVESIRRERSEQVKNNKDREVHFHFYTPEQKKITDYEVIDVTQ